MSTRTGRLAGAARTVSACAVAAGAALYGTGTAQAADFHWIKSNDIGFYDDASNWSPAGGPPGSADNAIFDLSADSVVVWDPTTGNRTNTNLTVSSGNVTFYSAGGSFAYTLTGTTTVQTGGILRVGFGNWVHTLQTGPLVVRTGGTFDVRVGTQATATSLHVGRTAGAPGTVLVSGAGSSLTVGTSGSWLGQNGATGNLTFQNGATGSISSTLQLAASVAAGTKGYFGVLGGSSVTLGSLTAGTGGQTGQDSVINLQDAGSTIIQTGTAFLTLGAASNSPGILNIGTTAGNASTVFTTGTGNITVNPTGSINIGSASTAGTFNANGNINISGGSLTRGNNGVFNLAAGRNLTASNGATVNFGGGTHLLAGGSTYSIQSGSSLAATSLNIATLPSNGTLVVDAASLSVLGSIALGASGSTAALTLQNGATGTAGGLSLIPSTAANTTANVSVLSGASFITGAITAGAVGGSAQSAIITVQGSGSTLTQTGANSLVLGHSANGTATLNVLDGGTFNTGTGTTTINATGGINIGPASASAFNANGDVNLNGGSITRSGGGSFNLAAGRTFTASNGAQVDLGATLVFPGGTTWNINTGAELFCSGFMDIVTSGVTAVTIDGASSSLNAGSLTSFWGANGHTAQVTVRNGASAAAGSIDLARSATAGTTGTISVESGASMSMGSLWVAQNGGGTTTGTVTVTGPGSTLTQTGTSSLTLGHTATGSATLNVLDGGSFIAGTGGTNLRTTGTVNIDGGFANLGPLNMQGGTLNFISGSLSYGGDLTIGTGGLFGTDLALSATKQLALTGTTTINPFRAITLDGGQFATGQLVIQDGGILEFNKGTLAITGAGGLTIGSGGPLGANLVVRPEAVLEVTNGLTNEGLITGGGMVVAALNNTAGGEVRAELGKTLFFDAAGHSNSGDVRLLGGRAEFGGGFTNQPTGRITGRGTLSSGGLINLGHVALSSGITDIFGDVTNNTGNSAVGITVSGNADVTYWDDVTNTSGLFRVSANSSATFFGTFAGNGISGPGDVYFEADITPGSSPGLAEFGSNVHLGPLANLEIELAGPVRGTQYDALDIAGAASLDGTLTAVLIDGFLALPGESFEIMTYSSRSGQFGEIVSQTGYPGLWFEAEYGAESLTLRAAALGGDANLDAKVDIADLGILASDWQGTGRNWLSGDFTGEGNVDIADLGILAANWQAGVSGGSNTSFAEVMAMFDVFDGVVVPEPAGLGLLGLAGILFLRRSRRLGA
jgi:T5SS/PEP-CTERM-associated repeat protein